MAKPRFTDSHRFAVPYVPSGATNIAKTHARIRRQLADQERREREAEDERTAKVRPMRTQGK